MASEVQPKGQSGPWSRDRIGFAREISVLVRDILLAVLIVYCILYPKVLRGWLGQLGISKLTLFGAELTPGKEEELAATIQGLTQELGQAQFESNSWRERATAAAAELARLQSSSTGETPAQTAKADQVIKDVRAAVQAAPRIAQPIVRPRAQQELIQGARRILADEGRWAVVFGGDTSPAAAAYEVGWAQRNGLDETSVYYRDGSYRSVALVGDPGRTNEILAIARGRRKDAFLVNLNSWCPRFEAAEGYRRCL